MMIHASVEGMRMDGGKEGETDDACVCGWMEEL